MSQFSAKTEAVGDIIACWHWKDSKPLGASRNNLSASYTPKTEHAKDKLSSGGEARTDSRLGWQSRDMY